MVWGRPYFVLNVRTLPFRLHRVHMRVRSSVPDKPVRDCDVTTEEPKVVRLVGPGYRDAVRFIVLIHVFCFHL